MREKLFSVDMLKNDDSAICFYKGCPNFHTLVDVFSNLLRKLEHITYWQGSDTTASTEKVSEKVGHPQNLAQKESYRCLKNLF